MTGILRKKSCPKYLKLWTLLSIIISHHYFEIDTEIIFEVCKNKIKPLRDAIKKILESL